MIGKMVRIGLPLLVVIGLFVSVRPTQADEGEWLSLGPENGQVQTLAIDPKNPRFSMSGHLLVGSLRATIVGVIGNPSMRGCGNRGLWMPAPWPSTLSTLAASSPEPSAVAFL